MTTEAWQPLLVPSSGVDEPFARWPTQARQELSDGAWIDHVPGWLRDADLLFDRLRSGVPWRADERRMYDHQVAVPRLTAWFGDLTRLGDPQVTAGRDALVSHYACADDPFVSAGLCLYRDGRDSVAWHGDRIGRGRREDTMVAVLSLGSARTFLLRAESGGATRRLTLAHGDLLVMGGSCQRTWHHCVPKTRRPVGPRISVQYRQRAVA